MIVNRSGSILAVDFGSVHTRAVLMDLVDGSYRMVARAEGRTTSGFPFDDVSVGMVRVVEELSRIAGRTLLDIDRRVISPEQADRSGVDYFIATASSGRPLRTIVLGLVPEISIASGLRAAAGTYVEVVETLSLDDARSEEEQLNAIVSTRPDLILITGGTENGAQEPVLRMVQLVQFALLLLERPQRPVVLYAGNSVLVPQIRAIFQSVTRLFIASNVRPRVEDEVLESAQLQLGLAFDSYKANRGGGFDIVGAMTERGVLPTAQSFNLLVEYLGRAQAESDKGVLAVDVGSAASTLSAFVNGDVNTAIRTDIGLGQSACNLLETAGWEAVQGWLPIYATAEDIDAYARNKALRPYTIPETVRDLYFEHALLRAGIQALLRDAQPSWDQKVRAGYNDGLSQFSLIIGAGAGLTRTGSHGFSALLLLDAFQPAGVVRLQIDAYGIVPALGALAYIRPEAVVQALDGISLETLGTSISLSGQPRAGRPAMKIRIKPEDGAVVEHELDGGSLWIYPLASGQTAQVDVNVVGRGTSIGGRGRVRITLEGGGAGVIFDARGRPLPLAKDARGRAAQMPLWLSQASGDPLIEIEERWLTPSAQQAAAETPAQPDEISAREPAKSIPEASPSRLGRRAKAEAGKQDGKKAKEESEVNEMDDLRNVLR